MHSSHWVNQRRRHALDLPIDAPVLLFVGRIQPLKSPDIAARAALYRRDAADDCRRCQGWKATMRSPRWKR